MTWWQWWIAIGVVIMCFAEMWQEWDAGETRWWEKVRDVVLDVVFWPVIAALLLALVVWTTAVWVAEKVRR